MNVIIGNPKVSKIRINPRTGQAISMSGDGASEEYLMAINNRDNGSPQHPTNVPTTPQVMASEVVGGNAPQPVLQPTELPTNNKPMDIQTIAKFKEMLDSLTPEERAMVIKLLGL